MSLFSLIQYGDKTGMIKVKVSKDTLPLILFMKGYTLFRFTEFSLIKNKHVLNVSINNINNKTNNISYELYKTGKWFIDTTSIIWYAKK